MTTEEQKKSSTPSPREEIRYLWVLLGATIMGALAFGAVFAAKKTSILSRLGDPETGFWLFEAVSGLSFFVGGFLVAILSPGKTVREPMVAAMLAFVAQTVFLWLREWIVIDPKVFLIMLIADGTLAYLGAWLGERTTQACKK